MNQLLSKEIEAQMVDASVELYLKELQTSKSKEYMEAFYDGYMFSFEMIKHMNRIYFGSYDNQGS